ncbi:hypothetical protein KIW84_072091 [Lathyrus oleraceus]|uniref:DUF4283 domain-containing protein n=1 Tax=Pisum sativum TaxID=3888 RepID=A0A9D4ZWQ8_PEA|nr:hypothetical protein KIW84_072090 [Pisum sativum]KAI5385358.1 hypothetical protein KIW84_072091 [Pisum sativum]
METVTEKKELLVNEEGVQSKPWVDVIQDLYYNKEGYLITRFKNNEDKENVMAQGSYFMYGKPLFTRHWTPYFEMKEDLLRVLPLWKPRETMCIIDHNGKIMEHNIENEWKMSYFQTCLKIGHDCALKKQPMKKAQTTKVWKPATNKPSVEEDIEDMNPKPNVEENNNNMEGEKETTMNITADNWIVVT